MEVQDENIKVKEEFVQNF